MTYQATKVYRTQILSFQQDPGYVPLEQAVDFIPDALLVLSNGKVEQVGPFEALKPQVDAMGVTIDATFQDSLMLPGFVDTHIHFPQIEMMGAYGEHLLSWLEKYVFPTEQKFADPEYAAQMAELFLDTLIAKGTTTAMVFGSVHACAADALFAGAYQRNMRLIAGKVMMDRHAPHALLDTPETSYQSSKSLIERWHGKGRLGYSVTPRFAPTSTPEQLQQARRLLQEYPDVLLQTHLSENLHELEWVKSLFPDCSDYLGVYEAFDLATDRSVFAHGIYLSDSEINRIGQHRSAISFCPTSNLFLGSGLLKWSKLRCPNHPISLGLGTDVGAGTCFNLLTTLNEAYKVTMLGRLERPEQQPLTAFEAFYLATLGGAKTLKIDQCVGRIAPGYEADLVALNWTPSPLQKMRQSKIQQPFGSLEALQEKLFALMMMGDDRNVQCTWVAGVPYAFGGNEP